MRKLITRTITVSTIKSAIVAFEKGKPVVNNNPIITVNGIITEEKALKEVRKVYGEKSQITEITSIDNNYEISVEDFIKHATLVEPTKDETKTEVTEVQTDD